MAEVIDPISSSEENITALLQKRTGAEEAARNIEEAKSLDLDPDGYADNREAFKKVEPVVVPLRFASLAKTSRQHASIVEEDREGGVLDYLERQAKFVGHSFKAVNDRREMNKLIAEYVEAESEYYAHVKANKDSTMAASKLDEITYKLDQAEEMMLENDPEQKYGLNKWEQIGGDIIGGVYDIGRGLWEQKLVTASSAVVGPTAIPVAMIKDSFEQTWRAVYNDLRKEYQSRGDLTQDALSFADRRAVAYGTGALVSVIDAIPFSKMVNSIPLVKRLKGKGVREVTGEVMRNKNLREAMKEIGSLALLEGGTEVFQDFIQAIGSNAIDENGNIDLGKGISTAWDEWNLSDATKTFIVGTGVGAGVQVAGRTAGRAIETVVPEKKPVIEKRPVPKAPPPAPVDSDIPDADSTKSVPEVSEDVLSFRNSLINMSDVYNKSRTNEFLPQEFDDAVQKTFKDQGTDTVYVTKDDVLALVDDENKEQIMKPVIDSLLRGEGDLDAPIEVPIAVALKAISKEPKAADIFKPRPETPSFNEFKKGLEGEGVNTDLFNHRPYMESVTFEKPENNVDLLKAKAEMVKTLKSYDKDDSIIKVQDVRVLQEQARREQEAIDFATNDNPTGRTIEAFMNDVSFTGLPLNNVQKQLVGEGKRANAINPDTLTPEQRVKYAKDKVMKSRKVFDKKGMSAKEAAMQMGFADVDNMLDVLRNTPTKAEATKNYVDYLEKQDNAKNQTENKLRDSRLVKAYDKVVDAHLKEAQQIKTESKQDVSIPEKAVITSEASKEVGSTPIKHLNPTKYKVGERVTQTKASNAIKLGDYPTALQEKIKSAINSAYTKESHVAVAKVNRAMNFIAGLEVGPTKVILDSSRKEIKDAITHLKNTFGFATDPNVEVNPDAMKNLQKFLNKEGHTVDVTIPEEVYAWTENQPLPTDLTPDQMAYVEDLFRVLVSAAENRALFFGELPKTLTVSDLDIIASQLSEQFTQQSNFSPENASFRPFNFGSTKFKYTWQNLGHFTQNLNYLIYKAENNQRGILREALYSPIMEAEGVKASLKAKWMKDYSIAAQKKYGSDFRSKMSEVIYVPEFAGIDTLENGSLQRMHLVMMLANLGNEVNADRLSNYGISPDRLLEITEKYLTKRDYQFVQDGMWKIFSDTLPEYAQLEFKTTGKILDATVARPIEAHGKTWTGGHLPLQYAINPVIMDLNDAIVKQAQDTSDGSKAINAISSDAFEGLVRSPHNKDRTGSDFLVDLTFESFGRSIETLSHDIAFREPVLNAIRLLNNPEVKVSLTNTIGNNGYNVLRNMMVSLTKAGVQDILFSEQKNIVNKGVKNLTNGAVITMVAGNMTSLGMNITTPVKASVVMRSEGTGSGGIKSSPFYQLATMDVRRGISKLFNLDWKDSWDLAREIDSSLDTHSELVEAHKGALDTGLPKVRRHFKRTNAVLDVYNSFMMNLISFTERTTKVAITNAAYEHFMSGNVKGYPIERLMDNMTVKERHEAAKKYARDVSHRSTYLNRTSDKAVIQNQFNNPFMKAISAIFNDARNDINNTGMFVNNVRYKPKEALKHIKEGDYVKAWYKFNDAGSNILYAYLYMTAMVVISDAVRGYAPFATEDERNEDGRVADLDEYSFFEHFGMIPKWIAESAVPVKDGRVNRDFVGVKAGKFVMGNNPFVRPFTWTMETGAAPLVPLQKLVMDASIGATGMPDTIQNYGLEAGFTSILLDTSDKEFREFMAVPSTVFALFSGSGIPMKPFEYIRKYLRGDLKLPDVGVKSLTNGMNGFIEQMDEFKSEHGSEEAEWANWEDSEVKDKESYNAMLSDFNKARDSVATALNGPTGDTASVDGIPERFFDIIRYAESSNKWNALNEESRAFGYYQFIPSTVDLMLKSPEGIAAGLVRGDFYSHSFERQHKAMRAFTQHNINILNRSGIPVTLQTLYATHHFNPKDVVKAYKGKDSDKLPAYFTKDYILKANPRMVKMGVRTLGDLKRYLDDALARGERSLPKTASRD